LLIKYLVNIPFVRNIFRSRALVRNGLVNVNGEKTPAVLNGYDVVTFIRTSSIREQALRSRVLFYFKRKNSKNSSTVIKLIIA